MFQTFHFDCINAIRLLPAALSKCQTDAFKYFIGIDFGFGRNFIIFYIFPIESSQRIKYVWNPFSLLEEFIVNWNVNKHRQEAKHWCINISQFQTDINLTDICVQMIICEVLNIIVLTMSRREFFGNFAIVALVCSQWLMSLCSNGN